MQKMRQAALTPRLSQPTRGQTKAVQGLSQHGQYALALPSLAQLAQLLNLRIKRFVIGGQTAQLGQWQAHSGQCQCGANQSSVLRHGHRTQPVHQVASLVALVDRVFVGQINRCDEPLLQSPLHCKGLCTGANQYRNVLRTQALQAPIGVCKAIVRIV